MNRVLNVLLVIQLLFIGIIIASKAHYQLNSEKWLFGVFTVSMISLLYWLLARTSIKLYLLAPLANGFMAFIYICTFPVLLVFDVFKTTSIWNLALGAGAAVLILSFVLRLKSNISIGVYTGLWAANIYDTIKAHENWSYTFDDIIIMLIRIFKPDAFTYVMIHHDGFLLIMAIAFLMIGYIKPKKKAKRKSSTSTSGGKTTGFSTNYSGPRNAQANGHSPSTRSTSATNSSGGKTTGFSTNYSGPKNAHAGGYSPSTRSTGLVSSNVSSHNYNSYNNDDDDYRSRAEEREYERMREREEDERRYQEERERERQYRMEQEEEERRREAHWEEQRREEEEREEERRRRDEEAEDRRRQEEEDDRRRAEEDAYFYRTHDGPSWKVDAADDELGRDQRDRDYEDDRWGYNRD